MSDSNTALMSVSAQQYIMKKATEAPEDIYATIKAAEDWLEELKNIARKGLNARIPDGAVSHDFDTALNTINVTRSRGNFKPAVVHETLTRLKIPTDKITFEKPTQYGCKPEAFDILEAYQREGVITKAQFDLFFEAGKFVVKVKPKSNLTVAVNRMESGE